MLKRKRVLTPWYFGTILNDAQKEPCVIIEIERQKITSPGDKWSPETYYWAIACGVVVIPWREVGTFSLHRRMPKWLYKFRLAGYRRQSRRKR